MSYVLCVLLLFASAVATWAAAARAKSFRSAKALAACSAERAAGCGARRAKETLAKMSCAGPRTSSDEALHIVKRLIFTLYLYLSLFI